MRQEIGGTYSNPRKYSRGFGRLTVKEGATLKDLIILYVPVRGLSGNSRSIDELIIRNS